MTVRIAINGALGRMGRAVGLMASSDRRYEIAAALESASSPDLGKDYGTLLGVGPLGVEVTPDLAGRVDAVIDFSTPEASLARLAESVKTKSPHVLCTTGLTPAQRKVVESASRKIPVLLASNTSIGVAAVARVAADLARMLGPGFDVEIVEMHHRLKKDSPSGTAITLGEAVAGATGRAYPGDFVFGRQGNVGVRPAREIGMHAVRGGGVVGDHSILFASDEEVVTISHRAGSRDLFARGALRAAEWISKAKKGFHSMRDVLAQPVHS